MSKKKVKKKSPSDASFETSLAELERIVGELESGKLELDASLDRYEAGVRHLKSCYQLLDKAERRIEMITGFDAEGNPITVAYDDAATEGMSGGRSQKRTAKEADSSSTRKKRDIDDGETLF